MLTLLLVLAGWLLKVCCQGITSVKFNTTLYLILYSIVLCLPKTSDGDQCQKNPAYDFLLADHTQNIIEFNRQINEFKWEPLERKRAIKISLIYNLSGNLILKKYYFE
jgi:hypothetical protein